MKRTAMFGICFVVAVLIPLFATVLLEAAEPTESEKKEGSITLSAVATYSGRTTPEYMYTAFPNTWSTEAYFDLTHVTQIPSWAVVTEIVINVDRSVGGFGRAEIAVFDENGEGF